MTETDHPDVPAVSGEPTRDEAQKVAEQIIADIDTQPWFYSHRADARALPLADRHYNRAGSNPGTVRGCTTGTRWRSQGASAESRGQEGRLH